MMCSNLWVGC